YPVAAYAESGRVIGKLKEKKVSFVISGSQWTSLCSFCDRITLLDRRHICKIVPAIPQARAIAERVMLGGAGCDVDDDFTARPQQVNKTVVFEASHLTGKYLDDISFTLNRGEILALHDPRKRALDELFDLVQNPALAHSGRLMVFNRDYDPANTSFRVVTTDFNMEKRFLNHMSLRDNLCMACYPRMSDMGVLRNNRLKYVENEFAKWYGNSAMIGLAHCDKLHERDKVAVYMFALKMRNPQLLFCTDPGVATDYAASQMIFRELREMAKNGAAVLIMLSSIDTNSVADRVIKLPPYDFES
ncbi:MAG: hypothetical protein Q4D04_15160, partial [Clostridia bacterium]|nr:hypothetical protein [Clostridia bacterium]